MAAKVSHLELNKKKRHFRAHNVVSRVMSKMNLIHTSKKNMRKQKTFHAHFAVTLPGISIISDGIFRIATPKKEKN